MEMKIREPGWDFKENSVSERINHYGNGSAIFFIIKRGEIG